jgi:hypothetical protein
MQKNDLCLRFANKKGGRGRFLSGMAAQPEYRSLPPIGNVGILGAIVDKREAEVRFLLLVMVRSLPP